jgi:hypothetical protein
MPTLKQLEEVGEPDLAKLHKRCLVLIGLLDGVLSSKVFNINFGTFSSIACMNPDCGKPVRRRIPPGQSALSAACLDCGMDYELSVAMDGQCVWRPVLEEIPCPGPSCEVVFKVPPGELKAGRRLVCHGCRGRFQIGLAVFSDDASTASEASTQSTS